MIGYVKTAPGFALRLAVSALVIWAFLHAVASAVALAIHVRTNFWASVVWVVAVGFMLVAIDARQLRYRVFHVFYLPDRGLLSPGHTVERHLKAAARISALRRKDRGS